MSLPNDCPIRVTMIIQDYLPRLGGAEKQLSTLAPLLLERGVEISILTRQHPGMSRFEHINGIPVYRLPMLTTKAVNSFLYTITALPILSRLKPKIIHAHGLLSPTTTAVTAKRFLNIPVVSKPLRGGSLGDLIRLKKKPMGRQRFNIVQKHVDNFITISHEIENELVNHGISPERCVFIPNGVKLDKFQPVNENEKKLLRQRLGLPEGQLVIFLGRLEKEKRVDQLIKIWPEVLKQKTDANLLILGDGSLANTLKSMAGKGVIFGGLVDDVAPYLQAADLFVLPSVSEGLSNALLEALASGLPVLATSTGGTTDIVRHKRTGWLIQDFNSQTLLEGIITFLSDTLLMESCAREGRSYVVQNYSVTNTADKLVKLYKNVLSGNSTAGKVNSEHRRINIETPTDEGSKK